MALAGPPLLEIGYPGEGSVIVGLDGVVTAETVRDDIMDLDSLHIVLTRTFDDAMARMTAGRLMQPLPIRICGNLVAEPWISRELVVADFMISSASLIDVKNLRDILRSGRCPNIGS